MSFWLFLDFLFLPNQILLPTLFLIGITTEKKISFLSICSITLLFDWILYQTKFLFFLGILFLLVFKKITRKNKWNIYLYFTMIYFLFYTYLIFITQNPFSVFLSQNILVTYMISLFCLFIKKSHHS